VELQVRDENLTVVCVYPPQGKLEVRVAKRTPLDLRYTDDAIDEALKGLRGAAISQDGSVESDGPGGH
jgi:hypothetical protein